MSSIDGTTPNSYAEEIADYYDPDRFTNMDVSEKEALRLLEQRMKDLQDLPHDHEAAALLFKLVGDARDSLQEMWDRLKAQLEAEEKKKEQAAKRAQKKAEAKAKPKTKPKRKPRKPVKPPKVEEKAVTE